MAKNISTNIYYSALPKSKYGIEYLEFVFNPANIVSNDDEGDVHHIHMTSLGGPDTPDNKVKLSVYNHIVAHLLLAKAVLDLNVYWKYEPLNAFNYMVNCCYETLNELNKVKLDEIYNLSEFIKISRKEAGGNPDRIKHYQETMLNKTQEEKEKTKSKKQNSWNNRENKDEYSQQCRERSINFFVNASDEWLKEFGKKCAEGYKLFLENASDEWKENYSKHMSEVKTQFWANASDEWKMTRNKKVKDGHNTPEAAVNMSKAQSGKRLMSDGKDKHWVMKDDIQDRLDDNWFFCDNKGNKKVA